MPPTTTAPLSPTAPIEACGRRAQRHRARAARRGFSICHTAAAPRAAARLFPCGRQQAPLLSCSSTAAIGSAMTRRYLPSSPRDPRPHGIDVALVGYTLAPDATPDRHRREDRGSLTFLAERGDSASIEPENCFVGGWSAGGHLTAMAVRPPGLSRRHADQRHLRSRANKGPAGRHK